MTERKHILFLTSWYPNPQAPALGSFIRSHALAASRFHNVSVVYACSDPAVHEGSFEFSMQEAEQLFEITVNYAKSGNRIPLLASWLKAQRYRKAMTLGINEATARFGKPDLVHLHVAWPAALAALPLVRETKTPLLLTEHWSGYLPEDGNYKGTVLKRFTQQAVAQAAHVTAVSQKMIVAMQQHGLKNTYSILPNVVDTERFHPAENKPTRSGLHLLHVSMLVEREKNISGILRVMATLKDRSDITLTLIGEGPERTAQEEQAAASGVLNKTVFFSGYKAAEGVAEAMRGADALLLFSHFEGMPVTIIEAQSSGLPVIATRTGAIPEMVNDSNGLLLDCGDENALRNAIVSMAEKKQNFDGKAIRAHAVDHYSMDAVARQLNELYLCITQRAR